ncbi:MAG: hypothetical protein J3R72DRAFT_437698 [Linnemannia gamsii]|nr:MAG: hypothetical protein J3R72DRAFT_437698 [Linnemannia gamsii]
MAWYHTMSTSMVMVHGAQSTLVHAHGSKPTTANYPHLHPHQQPSFLFLLCIYSCLHGSMPRRTIPLTKYRSWLNSLIIPSPHTSRLNLTTH